VYEYNVHFDNINIHVSGCGLDFGNAG